MARSIGTVSKALVLLVDVLTVFYFPWCEFFFNSSEGVEV